MPWEKPAIARAIQAILDSLEVSVTDPQARLTLQRQFYRREKHFGGDRGETTLLIRTITESEGNGPEAMIEPIVSAVSGCLRPEWTSKGLAFIEAFDQIPLVDILSKLRDLDLFPENELQRHYASGIQRRLWRIFGPDIVPEPVKAKPRPKLTRPSGVSERSWNDVLAIRKKSARRMAA
jgi:hypothetical protein